MITSWLLLIFGIGAVLLWLVELLAAAWYDVVAARLNREQRLHPHSRQHRQRPIVSVLIVSNGEDVSQCLDSIWSSSYRKLEVIVVANGPGLNKATTRRLLQGHPARLVVKRRPADRAAAILDAKRRYVHGEIVLLLEPGARLERSAIKSAVNRLNQLPASMWLLPALGLTSTESLWAMFRQYGQLLGQRRLKLRSLLHLELPFTASPVVFCWATALAQQLRQADQPGSYAADISATLQTVSSPQEWWRQQYVWQSKQWRRLTALPHTWGWEGWNALLAIIGSIAIPVILLYALYVAVHLQQPGMLGILVTAWAVVGVSAIWDNSHLSLLRKLGYLAGLPVTYGWSLVALVLNLATQIRLFLQTIDDHFYIPEPWLAG